MTDPTVHFFVVDRESGKTSHTLTLPSIDFVSLCPVEEGFDLVLFSPPFEGAQIAAFETALVDGALCVVDKVEDPVMTLRVAKLAAWEKVKERRQSCIASGVDVPGIGRFDSTPEAIQNVAGAALTSMIMVQAGLGDQVIATWTLRDNSSRDLTADEMLTVQRVGTIFINDIHARARDLRSEIEAAETIEELQAIDILAGWP